MGSEHLQSPHSPVADRDAVPLEQGLPPPPDAVRGSLLDLAMNAHEVGNTLQVRYAAVKRCWLQRYYHLCWDKVRTQYYAHCTSVDRVIAWCQQRREAHLKGILMPPERIPGDVLYFSVARDAYRSYLVKLEVLVDDYRAALEDWRETRSDVDGTLRLVSQQAPVKAAAMVRWWRQFRAVMQALDVALQEFAVPSFEEAVLQLAAAVEEAVVLDEPAKSGYVYHHAWTLRQECNNPFI
ncbi:hypothetical protein KEM52_003690 [Ascosphaera acerosa]|nr:hypothetical protein KEM52_003690 [Ascosphaera acerosa]